MRFGLTYASSHSCTDLLNITKEGLIGVRDWLGSVREDKLQCFMKTAAFEAKRENKLDEVQRLRYRIASALDDFKNDKRYVVIPEIICYVSTSRL